MGGVTPPTSRWTTQWIDGMLPGGFILASIYLISGNQHKDVEDNNRQIILQCFEQLKRLGRPFIIGGDWNMSPLDLEELNVLNDMPATIAAPFEWTCSAGRGRTIDFFVVSKHFKSLITGVRRLEGLSLATHWGVLLELEAGPGAAMEQQIVMPRKFPNDCPLGAPRPPPSYDQVHDECHHAREAQDLDWCFQTWAQMAEAELADRYHLPDNKRRAAAGRGELHVPQFKLVAAARKAPGRGAEGDPISRNWRRAAMAFQDLLHALKREWELDSQFIQQRLQTLRKLRRKNLDMGSSWFVLWYRLDYEWSWEDEWIRDCSWFAAQEATKLEQLYSKQRVKEWRQAVAKSIEQEQSKAHRW
eukprot:9467779-Pyramimonas_sp.AAC.1